MTFFVIPAFVAYFLTDRWIDRGVKRVAVFDRARSSRINSASDLFLRAFVYSLSQYFASSDKKTTRGLSPFPQAFGPNSSLRLSRPNAAKTGTTNDFKDAWTLGYTPNLAAGIWVGNNNGHVMRPGAAGIFVAAPIWKAFMEDALLGMPIEGFEEATPIPVRQFESVAPKPLVN